MAKGKGVPEALDVWVCIECANENHGITPVMGQELSVQQCSECGVPGACMQIKKHK